MALKTLKVTARPSARSGSFWVTEYTLMGGDEPESREFEVNTPAELRAEIGAWLATLELPAGKDGWTAHVYKTGARWPAGFKALSGTVFPAEASV